MPSSFLNAFFAGQLHNFYALKPGDVRSALELPRNVNRAELAAALRRYAKQLSAPKAVYKTLEKLEHPESRAVVTGQQAGLLLGPNYTLSKAITAINLAKELNTEERPVVPIFWIASQDHDVAEVNHAYVLDMNEKLRRLELPLPKDIPIGRISLDTSWVETIIAELKTLTVPEHNRQEVISLLERTSSRSRTFADWFAAILYELLGEQGFIVLNPMENDIAKLFHPILEAELQDPERSSHAINEAGERLHALGYEPQLNRPKGATNLFLEENGSRQLLRVEGKKFFTETHTYALEGLKHKLTEDPSSITPAAGLRPITQDAVLPSAINVLGPGELRYFAQIKNVYDAHSVAMSLTWPRATATLLEPPVTRILEKYSLTFTDVEGLVSHRDDILLKLHGHGTSFDEALQQLSLSLEKLLGNVNNIDPTLEGSIKRSEVYFQKTLEILKHKTVRALENRDDIVRQQFKRLEQHLLPIGEPQERLISPFSFFLKFGVRPVMNSFLTLPTKGNHFLKF
ncbi:MAG: bacillithiol biosynthesis cysteine-adding enzyme BshC [Trueperaceae bacterium]